MTLKGTELLERGGIFVFLKLLGNEKTSNGGGNLLRPLPQYLGDHLQSVI